jgi:hypothetical protein
VYVLRLYDLLPAAIRQIDQTNGSAGYGTLEGVVDSLDDVYKQVQADINGLPTLTDIDNVDKAYLPLIAMFLGVSYLSSLSSWSVQKKRDFTKSLVALWKRSGQRRAWQALLNAHGHTGRFPWELWKNKVYEVGDYSLFQDYDHRLKAARVDIRRVVDGDKYSDINNAVRSMLEMVRPIHVLIRWPTTKASGSSDFLFAHDTVQYEIGAEVATEQNETAKMPIDSGITLTKTLVGWPKTGLSETTDEHHGRRHQVGGGDEINVTGLHGMLADPQTPAAHDHDDIYLNKANNDPYTPTNDYNPATKKYVDDNAGSGALHFEETFTATDTKSVAHNLGTFPQVTVMDSSGQQIEVEVNWIDLNTVVLNFVGTTLTNAVVVCDGGM